MQVCYGLPQSLDAGSFICQRCVHLESCIAPRPRGGSAPQLEDVNCALCPRKGGVFKQTVKGTWVHMFCALITPGTTFVQPDILEGIDLKLVSTKVRVHTCAPCGVARMFRNCPAPLQRFNMKCYLCNKVKAGACLQCEDCYKSYHPMCAQKANCYFTWTVDVDGSSVRLRLNSHN